MKWLRLAACWESETSSTAKDGWRLCHAPIAGEPVSIARGSSLHAHLAQPHQGPAHPSRASSGRHCSPLVAVVFCSVGRSLGGFIAIRASLSD